MTHEKFFLKNQLNQKRMYKGLCEVTMVDFARGWPISSPGELNCVSLGMSVLEHFCSTPTSTCKGGFILPTPSSAAYAATRCAGSQHLMARSDWRQLAQAS